jgi:arabinan endo-1,5-alpha-L-arabinosidase
VSARHVLAPLCCVLLLAGCTTASPAGPTPTTGVTTTSAASPTAAASRLPQPIQMLPETFRGDSFTHDPSLIRTADGTYYVYATHNLVEVRSSKDGKTFNYDGSAFAHEISWGAAYGTTTDLWAPDVSFHNGEYWMYYAISSFGSRNSAIGLATSRSGAAGTWQDKGKVYASSDADDFNAIDPNLVVDAKGQWWLAFGSFWSGIKLIRLDPTTGLPVANAKRYRLAARPVAPGAIEAPFIRETGGWFYLYVSFDFCCRGAESTYRIMVGRSRQITGPYLDEKRVPMLDGGGTQLLASAGHEHGPGGESVVPTTAGDRLVFHFYDDNGTPTLGTRLLAYRGGWPSVVTS